jgi:hypothetical protein
MNPMMRLIAIVLSVGSCPGAVAQDFKVLWSTVGEVVSAGKDAVPVGRSSKVVRVDVEPAILPIAVGKQVCVSAFQLRAFAPDGRALAGAPLSIVIREDQKLPLQLTHPKGDLCMRASAAGEYPIRFTSKLPAPDATLRGAQIYLRVN